MSRPATTGPITVDSPIAGPKAANALAMSAGPKMSRISPNVCGVSSAAARPCNTRAAISDSGDHAKAQATDAAVKPPRPSSSIRRRP